jgi:hypothetical protein
MEISLEDVSIMFRIKNSRLFFRVQFLFNTLLFWSKLVDFLMTYKWNERHEVSCTKLLVCRLTWLCFKFGNILCNTLLMYLKIVHVSPHSSCAVLYRAQVLILVRCFHLHERQRERELSTCPLCVHIYHQMNVARIQSHIKPYYFTLYFIWMVAPSLSSRYLICCI